MATTKTWHREDLRPIAGFKAAGLWTLIEIGIHIGGLITVVVALFLLTGHAETAARKTINLTFLIEQPSRIVALLTLFVLFNRRRQGLTLNDLGYRFSTKILVASVLSTLLLMAVLEWGTSRIDTLEETERIGQLAGAGALMAGIYLLGNGILAPLIEEFAWRGFIQTSFRPAWGRGWALLVTALLFVGKHLVAEVSVARISTLIVFSLAVGYIRERWGTTASTITHLAANLVASLSLIAVAM